MTEVLYQYHYTPSQMEFILQELRRPFHPSRITWKPGSVKKDKTAALALAYADLRAYQDRLDEVCGMNWAVEYIPWGDKIIARVIINGIARSSTGEPTQEAERGEIEGTVAEAQAFKRACAMWGLGRYLYEFPSMWVDFSAETGRFTDAAKSRLAGIVNQHYQRYTDNHPLMVDASGNTLLSQQSGPGTHATSASSKHTTNNAEAHRSPAQSPTKELDELGARLYSDKWDEVKAHNIKRLTGKQQPASALTNEQVEKLVKGLKELERRRNPVPEDVNYYSNDDEWTDMGREADDNERKAKASSKPFVWPTDYDTLEICTGLVNSPDCSSGALTVLRKFEYCQESSSDKPMSEKQYGFMCSLIDKRYDGGHNAILSALTGRVINSECIPGWRVKELIDWLKDAEAHSEDLSALDETVESLKADLQKLEVA